MYDKIEKIGQSVIQHGKSNNRIYLLKLNESDYPAILGELETIASFNHYTKIFAKIPEWAKKEFQEQGYIKEAFIPNFYHGQQDVFFYSNFVDHSRSFLEPEKREEIDKNIRLAKSKREKFRNVTFKNEFVYKVLDESDVDKLTEIYKKVFKSYPFPIFEADYIKKTMTENIIYFGAFEGDNLVAASSAEMDTSGENAEMTDFATLHEYRGNNLSLILLREMEAEMRKQQIKTLYTIARSHSPGMNITFSKSGYLFAGTLINNTNIAGEIESMNVWYKNISM